MRAGELAHTPRKLWIMIQPIWNSRTNEAAILVREKSISDYHVARDPTITDW